MTPELPKAYDPHPVEERWSSAWLAGGQFHADPSSGRPPFCIVIPPPNVTGSLHMGHALNNTLQDILVRYKRMNGFNVLWLPGTDHAGIATQNVVEKELAKSGKRRQDLGRERFIEEVWRWKERHGNQIIHQLKRLGASCDWQRERFTMDEGLSAAVREAFVRLHEKGLIYRDLYLINWCPRCRTALSDLEVEHEEIEGHLWYLRYPLKEGSGALVVATTRPETMLGDTAVAVHPEDGRYGNLVGKTVKLPLVGREIPVIADRRVDKEFGTGAVKVTPAHDFNDFVLGNDHKLARVNLFTEEARMNENAIHFAGLDRFECRKKIVEELEQKGFLEKIEKHRLSVGHCYRCKTIVEPYLSLQWFVKARPLAEQALAAVRDGRTKFHPGNWTRTFEQWMEKIKDWCISRQIWWGHRIPAWYCVGGDKDQCLVECRQPIVSREPPAKCPVCGSKDLRQEEDVLDTWFSSALWPFSTLGWPDRTPELKKFYPTSVLVTGFDIIFFWVARMMMMGLEFMGEVPFRDVNIHALVRDIHGQKMSKSKGNVIDPLTVMDRFGTDAFRFTLAALAAQGRDIRLSEEVIEGYRNFCNKIWNAARYSLLNLRDTKPTQQGEGVSESPYDFWIRVKLKKTIQSVQQAIDDYAFDVAAKSIYRFFWHDFCDWYLEFSKLELNKRTLCDILGNSISLLHPFMPFITCEIWEKLGGDPDLIEKRFPKAEEILPGKREGAALAESEMVDRMISVIEAVRSIRGENHISPAREIEAVVFVKRPEGRREIEDRKEVIQKLGRLSRLNVVDRSDSGKGMAHAVLAEGFEVFVPLQGLIDFDSEIKRLQKEVHRLHEDQSRRQKRLDDQNFLRRADPLVVEEERAKFRENGIKLARLEETIQNLS